MAGGAPLVKPRPTSTRELGGSQRHRCGGHLDGDVGAYAEPQLWSSTFGRHSDAHAERLHVERADPAGAWARARRTRHRRAGRGRTSDPWRSPRRWRAVRTSGRSTRAARAAATAVRPGRPRARSTTGDGWSARNCSSQVHAAATDARAPPGGASGGGSRSTSDAQLCTGRASGERRRAGRRHRHRERRGRVAAQREVHTVHGRRLDRCRAACRRRRPRARVARRPAVRRGRSVVSGPVRPARPARASAGRRPAAEQSDRVGLSDQRVRGVAASRRRRRARRHQPSAAPSMRSSSWASRACPLHSAGASPNPARSWSTSGSVSAASISTAAARTWSSSSFPGELTGGDGRRRPTLGRVRSGWRP